MIKRLVLWLCSRFDINIIEERRLDAGQDAVERGARWEQFAREEGGLYDMLEVIEKDIFLATQELRPTQTEELYAAALAARSVRQLRGQVEMVVAAGELEKQKIKARESTPAPRLKSVNL